MDLDKILQEKFTSPVRKGYVSVNEFTFPEKYLDLKAEIDNFEVKEEDVWVCSFPKSGTTWTQEMVWMIINNLDFEKGRENLDARSPFLEFSIIKDYSDFPINSLDVSLPTFRLDSLGFAKKQQSPTVFKTHLPYDLLPQEIRNGAKKPKIIYVAREPKDVCVSYYHHSRLLEHFTGTFEEFSELFLGGKVTYAPFWKHVFSFWDLRDSPNLLFLKYEEMKKDLPAVIRKVAKFLERPLNEDQVEILAKHLSFETMKKNPAVNKQLSAELSKKLKLNDAGGAFMRAGTVGGYKNIMSEGYTRRFDEWIKENVANTDYTD